MPRVTNMLPRLHHAVPGILTLKPGHNEVTQEQLDLMMRSPGVKRAFDRGVLKLDSNELPPKQTGPISTPVGKPEAVKEEGEPAKNKVKTKANPILDLSEDDAIEVASNEEDVKTLRSFLVGEKRDKVKQFVQQRITALKSNTE